MGKKVKKKQLKAIYQALASSLYELSEFSGKGQFLYKESSDFGAAMTIRDISGADSLLLEWKTATENDSASIYLTLFNKRSDDSLYRLSANDKKGPYAYTLDGFLEKFSSQFEQRIGIREDQFYATFNQDLDSQIRQERSRKLKKTAIERIKTFG